MVSPFLIELIECRLIGPIGRLACLGVRFKLHALVTPFDGVVAAMIERV
jgi:hypothetical protein